MSRKSGSGTIKEEISSARANLEQLLKNISVNRDSSPTQTDDEGELKINEVYSATDAAETSPRRKSAANAGKKRKRMNQDITAKPQPQTNTFVVKLFDRSVDLAPYNESTPLYPICRAWTRNNAGEQKIHQAPLAEPASGGEAQFPAPYMKNNKEDLSKLRIPETIKRGGKQPLDLYTREENAEKLLFEHLAHWKKVRDSWRVAGRNYEARFSTSHAIIKQMYDSAPKA